MLPWLREGDAMFTRLEQDCLNVVAELAGKGDPPTTEDVAIELDVPFAKAQDTLSDLSRLARVRVEGARWRPFRRQRVKLPPEPVLVRTVIGPTPAIGLRSLPLRA